MCERRRGMRAGCVCTETFAKGEANISHLEYSLVFTACRTCATISTDNVSTIIPTPSYVVARRGMNSSSARIHELVPQFPSRGTLALPAIPNNSHIMRWRHN